MREDEAMLDRILRGRCRFNEGVRCDDPQTRRCSGCGWNPRVQLERKRRRKERYEH